MRFNFTVADVAKVMRFDHTVAAVTEVMRNISQSRYNIRSSILCKISGCHQSPALAPQTKVFASA